MDFICPSCVCSCWMLSGAFRTLEWGWNLSFLLPGCLFLKSNTFGSLFGGLSTHAQTPPAHRMSCQARGWVEVCLNGRRFGCICQSKNTRSQSSPFIPPSEHRRLLRNDLELTSCHVVHLVLRAFGGITRWKSKLRDWFTLLIIMLQTSVRLSGIYFKA